jgi:hypothetical protein
VTASTVSSITAATNPTTFSFDYLIIGGGGAGGGVYLAGSAGGGGAGELLSGTTTLAVGARVVTVGAGGTETSTGLTRNGGSGTSSSLDTIGTADGGGGGGMSAQGLSPASALNGASGGSGGGGGANNTDSGTGGANTGGYNGGNGFSSGTVISQAGGGGGGSAASGANGASGDGGDGGAGTSSSITGTALFYAAGGGGAGNGGSTGGSSGAGGGGSYGANGANATTPGSGGGGAGSAGSTSYNGGSGADGIVVISYTTGTAFCTGGNITKTATKTIHTFTDDGVFEVLWINPGGLYFVSFEDTNGKIKLSDFFDPYSTTPLTHGTTGSITFSTVAVPNQMLAKDTENYNTASATEHRYYMLDANGYLWVYDTQVYTYTLGTFGVATTWMLVDPTDYDNLALGGIAVLNGNLMAVGKARIYFKPTIDLGSLYLPMSDGFTTNPFPTHVKYAITGTQGKMYYTDNQFLGEVFPTTSLVTSEANIQSYCKYTASSTTGTISALINGSTPYLTSGTRVPAIFFTDSEGTIPTALTWGSVYFIEYNPAPQTFSVYATDTSTTALDIATGATGNQYFNTFFPIGQGGPNGSEPLVQFQPQRLNLPFYEQATSLLEVGNQVLVGCEGAVVYPWNQVDAIPSDVIQLPEANVKTMINVNNMAYIFAGNKGNIYISNGSVASLVLKVPDYCAGVPGTPFSYIEPYFTWGDAMFLRGRVYFSILDQTATKAGNCGGIWSFIPSQNVDPSQEVGVALRLENQNSYGDYDGYANILLPAFDQAAKGPQYWAAWQDSYNTGSAAFGIDTTASTPVTSYVVETDLIPTGTLLAKDTFTNLEYKLSSELAAGDSVQLFWRINSTDAWTSAGTTRLETDKPLSGYYDMTFQKTQWVQFRAVVTTSGTTASSFVRLTQIRLR